MSEYHNFFENISINIWIAFIACFTVTVLFSIKKFLTKPASKKTLKSQNKPKNPTHGKETKVKETLSTTKNKKKAENHRWNSRDKQNFSHSWLITSFKGHSDQVLDVDLSSNGKYLASCSEDALDPGGEAPVPMTPHEEEETLPGTETKRQPPPPVLSRRQRKNRKPRVEEPTSTSCSSGTGSTSSSVESSPDVRKKNKISKITPKISSIKPDPTKMELYPPLRIHTKLNIEESLLEFYLRSYMIAPEQLINIGYPVECTTFPGRAIIYRNPIIYSQPVPITSVGFDVNAREFVPRFNNVMIVNKTDNLPSITSVNKEDTDVDSGQGSGTSSPLDSENSDVNESMEGAPVTVSNSVCGGGVRLTNQRNCVRCGRYFLLGPGGEYLTREECVYHWGKLHRFGTNHAYTCCNSEKYSKGCTTCKVHVWNGIDLGINGPLDGYVRTRRKRTPPVNGNYGVYALDCEMCYTSSGLELTKVSVVATDGHLVYDCFVRPDNEIVDYNTRFSGITARDLKGRKSGAKSLKEVQNDLMDFISADTVLIGHGLENDLRALRILHSTVVDTSVSFPHNFGLPYRRSLKSITSAVLRREIQNSGCAGHNSVEDARACMELMLWRVRNDFKAQLEQRLFL